MLVFSENKAGKDVTWTPSLIHCCLAAAVPSTPFFSAEKPKAPVFSGVQQQESYGREPGLGML